MYTMPQWTEKQEKFSIEIWAFSRTVLFVEENERAACRCFSFEFGSRGQRKNLYFVVVIYFKLGGIFFVVNSKKKKKKKKKKKWTEKERIMIVDTQIRSIHDRNYERKNCKTQKYKKDSISNAHAWHTTHTHTCIVMGYRLQSMLWQEEFLKYV